MTDYKASVLALDLSKVPETVVIVGGTSGVGAAIARRLASQGVSKLVLCGRKQDRAEALIAKLNVDAVFVKGDVSTIKGIRQLAEDLQKACGRGGINYLIQTQNGPPTGDVVRQEDGEDKGFIVQAFSRFALCYLLDQTGTLAQDATIMCIANPGNTLAGLQVDDLSLKRREAAGRYRALLFLDESMRDSSVIDASLEEFSARHPQYRILHLGPGLVLTMEPGEFVVPFPWNIVFKLAFAVFSLWPDDYAFFPVYAAFSPEEPKEHGKYKLLGPKLQPYKLGAWASDPTNRTQLWDKLVTMLDT